MGNPGNLWIHANPCCWALYCELSRCYVYQNNVDNTKYVYEHLITVCLQIQSVTDEFKAFQTGSVFTSVPFWWARFYERRVIFTVDGLITLAFKCKDFLLGVKYRLGKLKRLIQMKNLFPLFNGLAYYHLHLNSK